MFWFGVGSMLILTALYLVLSVLNEWRQRRRVWPDTPDDELPFVSVVLAAYNEDKVIATHTGPRCAKAIIPQRNSR